MRVCVSIRANKQCIFLSLNTKTPSQRCSSGAQRNDLIFSPFFYLHSANKKKNYL